MAKAGWSIESTFAKYYNKYIVAASDLFQDAVPVSEMNFGFVGALQGCSALMF